MPCFPFWTGKKSPTARLPDVQFLPPHFWRTSYASVTLLQFLRLLLGFLRFKRFKAWLPLSRKNRKYRVVAVDLMETWIEVTLAIQATNREYRIIAIFAIAILAILTI